MWSVGALARYMPREFQLFSIKMSKFHKTALKSMKVVEQVRICVIENDPGYVDGRI